MSFTPLPEILTDLIERPEARRLRAVEMGCGDGRLLALLRRRGLPCLGLDRMPRAAGSAADVRADALRPPLLPRSLDLVIAANLVRHLAVGEPRFGFLEAWVGLLKPGGSVFILEDEPTATLPAAARYRDLQAFLARVMPGQRGALLSLASFRRRLPPGMAACLDGYGVADNAWALDAAAAVGMLRGGRPAPGGEADRLAAAISADGLACGRMWWCRLRAARD